MTNLHKSLIAFDDSQSIDPFKRARVSIPVTVFDGKTQYSAVAFQWENSVAGSGSATHLPNESSVRLRCTTTSGDAVYRQSHRYFRYQPDRGHRIDITGVMGAIKENVRQRIGYFDVRNGVFFEQNGSTLRVVRRSKASGSVVDLAVDQADWNIDGLNAGLNPLNPSGITLDNTQGQVFVLDMQWLGHGRIRFGFDFGDRLVYCHEMKIANELNTVSMTTATLPVRFEIENTGTAASTTDLITTCVAVTSEGGQVDSPGNPFSADNGITSISVTTRRPVLSIRPALLFNSIPNRLILTPDIVTILLGSGSALLELVYNPTSLTNASFAAVNSASGMERDVAATALTGGTIIDSWYASGGVGVTARGLAQRSLLSKLGLTLDMAETTADILTLVATAFTGSVDVNGAFHWSELS